MEIDERIENWSFDDREMIVERPRHFVHLGCFDQLEDWRVQWIAL